MGSWQRSIAEMAVNRAARGGAVAWSEVMPRGRAGQYSGRYQTSFVRLNGRVVDGHRLEIGGYGPRGGLAIRAVAL